MGAGKHRRNGSDYRWNPVRFEHADQLYDASHHRLSLINYIYNTLFQVNLEDISLLIGTTRQTASSLFNNLIRNGYLVREGRKVFIISRLEDLKRLLECGKS